MFFNNHQTRPHLLLVGNFQSRKGGNRCVGEELAEHLEHAGYRVTTTSSLRVRPLRFIDMVGTVWLRRREYQVVYIEVFSGLAFIWAEASAHLLHFLRKPFVLTLHGGNLPSLAKKKSDRVRKMLTMATKVVTPSKFLYNSFVAIRPDIQVIPNPIEIENNPFQLRQIAEPKLIWLRAFHEIYNPSLAPKVLAELVVKYPLIQLTMVGPDKGDGSLEKMKACAETLQVRQRITLAGQVPRDEVPGWLNQADIFINTTNIDNTPVSVIEAMACGLCIVSTNVGGIPYLLEDGVDALLVSPNDPKAMADAIDRILADPQLAASLSDNARRKAEGFSWSKILPVWEELFETL